VFCLAPDSGYFDTLIQGAIGGIHLERMNDNQLSLYKRALWAIQRWADKEDTRINHEQDRRTASRERIGA
jgi:hypothetical protein